MKQTYFKLFILFMILPMIGTTCGGIYSEKAQVVGHIQNSQFHNIQGLSIEFISKDSDYEETKGTTITDETGEYYLKDVYSINMNNEGCNNDGSFQEINDFIITFTYEGNKYHLANHFNDLGKHYSISDTVKLFPDAMVYIYLKDDAYSNEKVTMPLMIIEE